MLFRLDVLRHHRHIFNFRHFNNGFNHNRIQRLALEIANKAAVNLYDIRLQALQAFVVGIARTKIINGDSAAKIAQQLNVMHTPSRIAERLLFGNLDGNASGDS